jgi:hypothetical protein
MRHKGLFSLELLSVAPENKRIDMSPRREPTARFLSSLDQNN